MSDLIFHHTSQLLLCFFQCLPKWRIRKFSLLYYPFFSWGNIFSPVRYSDLSILPDDNADNFAAALLTHFQPMFHLWINQVVGFYKQNV